MSDITINEAKELVRSLHGEEHSRMPIENLLRKLGELEGWLGIAKWVSPHDHRGVIRAAAAEIRALSQAFQLLAGYALTCQRKNTREWMFGLEDAINRAAALAGDPDRAVLDSGGMAMWIKRNRETPKG